MKCVISCCLLALCAFETVVASYYDDAYNSIDDFTAKRQNDIQTFIHCEDKVDKYNNDCKKMFKDPVWDNHEYQIGRLTTCNKQPKSCYDGVTSDAKDKANRIYDATRKCVTPAETKCFIRD